MSYEEDYIDHWMSVFQAVVRKRNGLFIDNPLKYTEDGLLATFTSLTNNIVGSYDDWLIGVRKREARG